jgi:putative ABC transport system permease protein
VLATTAVITIALAIGANAAIFSAVNAVVLRPLPFKNPDELVVLADENPEKQLHLELSTTGNWLDWRDGVTAFTDMAAYDYGPAGGTIRGIGEPRRGRFGTVTGNLFSVLGVRAELGNTLDEKQTWNEEPATIVLSHAAWVRDFGGDPNVIGRKITIDDDAMRVVGVMPASFSFPFDSLDGWIGMRWAPDVRTSDGYRRTHWMRVVARLKPGVTADQASVQLNAVATRLEHDYPKTNRNLRVSVTGLHEFLIGDTRLPLFVLLASVAILLVIACANVANLLLSHAGDRHREIALRLALGAGRSRVVRQAITESLVLSVIGGVCGLALGWAGTRVLSALQPDGLLRVRDFNVDIGVVAYVALMTTLAGVLFGAAPALWIRRRDPADVLRSSSRSGTSTRGVRRWSDGLVVVEVALALLMMTGATLLVRSAWNVSRVDPGYQPHGVIAAGLALYGQGYDTTARRVFFEQLQERAKHIPGVTNVAFTGILPLMWNAWTSDFRVEGRPSMAGIEAPHWFWSPDYVATLRVRLARGRTFTAADLDAPVVMVNETFARTQFPGQNPIGKRLTFDKPAIPGLTEFTIVGVVGDVYDRSLIDPPRPTIIHPFRSLWGGHILLRTDGDPASLVVPLRNLIHELDPRLALSQPRQLEQMLSDSMARGRFFALVLGVFAVVGWVLAIVGVYGVLAQLARSRAREMGIRVALGAPLQGVRWLIVGHGVRLAVAGLVIGGVAALLATRALTSLLFGISPTDPAAFVGVALTLVAAAGTAAWIPALRATREGPASILRGE